MPEEILALLIVVSSMTFIVTLLKSSQNYRLKKIERETGRTTADQSLTTTELEELIQDAVVDATAPLQDEMKMLTARVDELDGGSRVALLEDEHEEPEKTLGRQTRQRQR